MTIGSNGYAKFKVSTAKTVKVTKNLIEEAQKSNSGHCMIAEAVKILMPEARFVSVDLQTIRWSNPKTGTRHVALTPRIAQEALVRWDIGQVPKPFSFQLRGNIEVKMQRRPPHKLKSAAKQENAGSGTFEAATPTTAKVRNKTFIKVKKNGPRSVKTVRVGGKTPPRVNMRRAFGLRGLSL